MKISTRHATLLATLAVLATLATAPAFAKMVDISGKHSKDEIRSACAKAGGINNSGQDGHGYGCYNPEKGTLVACNDGGDCTGYVPGRSAPPNINDVLKGSGAPTGAADFGGNGKHGSDTAGTGGGANGNGGSGHANMTGDAAPHSGSANGGIGGAGVIQ